MMKLYCLFPAVLIVFFNCAPRNIEETGWESIEKTRANKANSYLNNITRILGRPELQSDEAKDEEDLTSFDHAYYIGSIDCDQKATIWISHVIEPIENEEGSTYERDYEFSPDTTLPENCQTRSADYTNTGFDRGHLAAAKDFAAYGDNAIKLSFLTSNILPQVGSGFNRDLWKNLESQIREWGQQKGRMLVYTGPILTNYDNVDITEIKNNIPVPSAFFKIVVYIKDNKSFESLSFIIGNTDHRKQVYEDSKLDPLCVDNIKSKSNPRGELCARDNLINISRHLASIHEIELATNLKFFRNIADNSSLKMKELRTISW